MKPSLRDETHPVAGDGKASGVGLCAVQGGLCGVVGQPAGVHGVALGGKAVGPVGDNGTGRLKMELHAISGARDAKALRGVRAKTSLMCKV